MKPVALRRMEDKIRGLCAQIVAANKDQEVTPLLVELRDALHQHIERLRTRLADYPSLAERRGRLGTLLASSVAVLEMPSALEPPAVEKPSVTLPGTVEKIISPPYPTIPEKAQIVVEGADHLYREIRIDNALTDEQGEMVSLKKGAEVEVTVEADPEATTPATPAGT
jgi:hypothetical protein